MLPPCFWKKFLSIPGCFLAHQPVAHRTEPSLALAVGALTTTTTTSTSTSTTLMLYSRRDILATNIFLLGSGNQAREDNMATTASEADHENRSSSSSSSIKNNSSNIRYSTHNEEPLFHPNKDESKVPSYQLPEILEFQNTKSMVVCRDSRDWAQRRTKILDLFRQHIYGTCPEPDYTKTTTKCQMETTIISNDKNALQGLATRREIRVKLSSLTIPNAVVEWIVLIYLPNNYAATFVNPDSQQIACFLALNFAGNQAIHPDPDITETPIVPGEEHFATHRGGRASKWPVETILQRGYGLATVYSGQVEPDHPDTAFTMGVHRLFGTKEYVDENPASWGTIAAWSWGLSRTLDVIMDNNLMPEVDGSRVAVMGHSRKGKAALWAAAEDTRFALAISNDSGCCGAALSRRRFGETIQMMNARFPTWTCARNKQYNDNEKSLPVEQHQLVALVAPRPVYVASAVEDWWADPKGEFLSAKLAEPIYHLLGVSGLDRGHRLGQELNDMAKTHNLFDEPGLFLDCPFHGPRASIGYHCRSGGHDVLTFDWNQYLNFADLHLRL